MNLRTIKKKVIKNPPEHSDFKDIYVCARVLSVSPSERNQTWTPTQSRKGHVNLVAEENTSREADYKNGSEKTKNYNDKSFSPSHSFSLILLSEDSR